MTQLNKNIYTISNVTTNTFDVTPFNAENFTAWTSGGTVGKVYEISTPYDEGDIARLQFRQKNDVVYIVNTDQNYPLYKLQRAGNTNWSLTKVGYSFPPVLDVDTSLGITLTPSGTLTPGGTVTITASSGIFLAGHVGSRWMIRHPREDISNSVTLSATSTFPSTGGIRVRGEWSWSPHGVWDGDAKIERSYNLSSPEWENYLTTSNRSNTKNEELLGSEPVEVLLRVNFTRTSGDLSFDWNIEDYDNDGIFEITAVNSTTSVTATVIKEILNTNPTKKWAEAAFSDVLGHPSAIEFYKGRLWIARDDQVFGSASDDFENFERTGLDDGAIYRPLPSSSRNKIKWMIGKRHLLFGTEDGLYAHRRPDNNQATTPDTFAPEGEVYYGMGDLPPLLINNVVIFAEKENRIFRELSSDLVEETFKGINLTQLAAFITGSTGITDLAYQRSPLNILWGVRGDDGKLVSMVYDRQQNHIAWSEHETVAGDEYVTVETTASSVGDELWLGVKRYIPGLGTRYYIERRQSEKTATNSVSIVETESDGTTTVKHQDVVYLIDMSGSTGDDLATFQANAPLINAGIEEKFSQGTVRYALYTFGKNNLVTKISDFTNRVAIEAAIATLSGPSGSLEYGYEAIYQAANDLSWRTGADVGRNIIMLTDEDSDTQSVTMAQAIAACQAKSIIFNYGFSSQTDYAQIAAQTGGVLIEEGEGLVDNFIASIKDIRVTSSFEVITRAADYLDCAKYYESVNTITGLEHLESATVWANADGVTLGPFIVENGSITLGNSYHKVWVGLLYYADIETSWLEYLFQSGSTRDKAKTITQATIDTLESVGILAGIDVDNLEPLKDEPIAYNQGLKSSYSVPRVIPFTQHVRTRTSVYIRSNQPQPCYIAGIYPELDIHS
ncbi:MAG: VWA domain-containing protein [Verrucomicrobiota bacterium JB024]|nr:VWA domain-containing protein [Verrucomicrobiota bacterium JB024]